MHDQIVKPLVEPGAKPRHGQRAALIRRMKCRYPEMEPTDIAKRVGCSRQNVRAVLSTFLSNHTEDELRDFQANKADVYDSLGLRFLASVTTKKLAKTSAQAAVVSAAILEDKARLVRGQATGINMQVLLDVAEMIRNEDG